MNGPLFLILRAMDTTGIDGHVRRQRYCGCILRAHMDILTELRNRRRDNTLRESLVIDVCHIIYMEPIRAICRIQVLTAQLKAQRVPAMMIRDIQLPVVGNVPVVIVRICELVQITSDHCLRLIRFRSRNGLEAIITSRNIYILPHEIYHVGAVQQELRHPRIIIVLR